MLLLKLIAGLATVAAMLPLPAHEPAAFLTVPQRDEWRATHDPPSVSRQRRRPVSGVRVVCAAPADTNRRRDIYVLDRTTGKVTLETVMADGLPRTPTATILASVPMAPCSSIRRTAAAAVVGRYDNVACRRETPRRRVDDRDYRWRRDRVTTVLEPQPRVSGDGRTVVFGNTGGVRHRQRPATVVAAAPDDVTTGAVRRVVVDARMSTRSSVALDVTHDGRLIAFTSTAQRTLSERGWPTRS